MKRISKALAIAILCTLGMFWAGSAVALPYAPAPALSVVGCSDVDSGIAVQLTGLLPGSTVTISGSGSAGLEVTASANGSASATLPTSRKGDYAVTANGVDADGAAWAGTATVTVVKSCESTEPDVETAETVQTVTTVSTTELPKTGGDTALIVALGAGAILVGVGAVVAARYRRVSDVHES